jgi:hypothetical protein
VRRRLENRHGENFTQLRCIMGDGGDADLSEGDASLASTNPISCDTCNYTSTVKKALNFDTLLLFLGKCAFLSYIFVTFPQNLLRDRITYMMMRLI